MEVILLQQIRKLGSTGAVVDVKNGYARNFLIPNGKALRATKDNMVFFESKKEEFIKLNNDTEEQAKLTATKIDGAIINIIEQAGEDGRLYGSVTAPAIADALATDTKQDVDRQQVSLNTPIKYIGVHTVPLELFGDINAEIHVNVARTKDEAADAKKRFEAGEIVMEGPDGPEAQQKIEETVAKDTAAEEDNTASEEADKDGADKDSEEEAA